jgi:uncharacterized protein (DUF488 family)
MTLFTIGFTKKSAERFFESLREAGVCRVVDVRLNNSSQLAGFSKRDDLKYFLKAICGIEYAHLPEFAPTQEILDEYKKEEGSWERYETLYLELLRERAADRTMMREFFDGACLLCSEATPEHCHRRLLAEYLRDKWGELRIVHI